MKFRCKQSKNIYEFALEHDINTMLKHPDYEAVVEDVKEEEEAPKTPRKYNKGQ